MNTENRIKRTIIVAIVGLFVNLLLGAVKLYIGQASNSLIILSDAVNNFTDGVGLLIITAGFILMRNKPTKAFPLGFGRVEYLVGFVFSVILVGTGCYLAFSAIERFLYPYFVQFTWLRFGVILASVSLKIFLALWFKFQNRHIMSNVLHGEQLDSWLDVGITLMTLIGFVLTGYTPLRLDAIFGFAISIIIVIAGIKLLIGYVKEILGKPISDEISNSICEIAANNPAIIATGSITTHSYGINKIQVIIELVFKKNFDLKAANAVSDDIIREVLEKHNVDLKILMKESAKYEEVT
ncbi:MAG: cation diffusion facilitator family transporter [Christensenellaceae bacterium]|jgi:cation diffusion facilitator family transporter|nr:cation diffusion facilitator family transporter [Christensenellaceae bacterium]